MAILERQRLTQTSDTVASPARRDAVRSVLPAGGMAAKILGMQQTLGNQAVQHMAITCPAFPSACPTGGACHTCPARVQAKLTINQPGDVYEQEADRVAEEVLRMPEPYRAESRIAPDVQIHIDALRDSGHPLPESVRAFFEPRFGYDFSQVRVHTDSRAGESARAYTIGRDIVFGAGEYRPHEARGQRLLSHELAHTVQQAHFSGVAAQANLEIGPAEDPLEHEADRTAEQLMSSSPRDIGIGLSLGNAAGPMLSLSRPMLQRQEKTEPPLIPIPVFDELDPMIVVPDIPGVPSFLRGQQVKLSTLRSALDVLRGGLPSPGPGRDICQTLLPGYERASSGDVAGLCCPQFVRERARCCRPQDIGLMSFRCCTPEEVIVNNRCVRPERARLPSTPSPALPTLPPLELRIPGIRFGTIQSDTIDHFALNSDTIPSTATAVLDRLASQLQLYREVDVHVEGHTDSSYTEEYNQRLSERRTQAVRDALMRRGVDSRRIVAQGFGETRLLFPSESNPEEKARNRRVEVWFYIPPSRGLGEELRLRPSTPLAP